MTLYQFPFSHFCEKVRWALDYKGLTYQVVNLVPGLHAYTTQKLAPKSSVPILVDGQPIQDSTQIITHLDQAYPQQSLTPVDPVLAKTALQWEQELGETVGVPLRQWFYFHLLPHRQQSLRFMLQDAPWFGQLFLRLMYVQIREKMQARMQINAETSRQAERQLACTFDRLDAALLGRQHLVGETFSRADLTAAALLGPLCVPSLNVLQSDEPEPVAMFRAKHESRPCFQWVIDLYQAYR